MGSIADEKSKSAPLNDATNGGEGSAKASKESPERPPSYNQPDEPDVVVQLPQLKLTDKDVPVSETTQTVSRDQVVAHLKFLAVLGDLRDFVSNSDGLFGLFDSAADKYPDSVNEARVRIREKRWAVYTARAVDRYQKWWSACLPMSRSVVRMQDLSSATYETIVNCDTKVLWSVDNMPPIGECLIKGLPILSITNNLCLDILMVWHSHMLNPRDFLEDCIRSGKMSTWRTGFPFAAVNDCINDRTLEYTVPEKTRLLFQERLKLSWDNFHDPPGKDLECPRCTRINTVLWTEGGIGESAKEAFKDSTGFADRSFATTCKHCRCLINHDRLRVAKFRSDLIELLNDKLPMPGSIYNLNGVPEGLSRGKGLLLHQYMLFPSLLMEVIGRDLLAFTDPRLDRCRDIDGLRKELEMKLRDRKVVSKAHQGVLRNSSIVRPGEKVHFRRMMSHYWENFSPFALDLVGAVIRQGTFVQKMDNIDWLHSPTVMETADRLIKKYNVFFQIMYDNPSKMAVPTLDVDLAWHTHQLQPRRYYKYSTRIKSSGLRIFFDHDDKVDENKLSESFEWTSKMYRRATDGAIYSECTCWYCEATRAPDLYDRLFNMGSASRARDNADTLHDRADISSDPDKNPHISAHNAVRPSSLASLDPRVSQLQRIRLHQNYEKAVRRAEKRGRVRSDAQRSKDGGYEPYYYAPYVWGYPIVVPYYGPYMCDPGISSDSYACNPSCMNVNAGAVGNCCSGTCGGGVAAGACGGAGGFGCAGGSGAACGGGGSACGGGGGGGCGGGGGGGCGGGGGG
ncbi:uncharacterized protein N7496_001039 [Penicillium cataractarum]|uniref:Uncharacterized protein n=1 Tax=Penicillium cataractarum TaxID=2100454 RepID=A0A9W9VV74_9EURO|nr:uncharacterized protein N7496_001039 [Penicillium cataractarum]KAJ5389971.1 hypothetical protein N7496_001039 [Penicillium cataractarum]